MEDDDEEAYIQWHFSIYLEQYRTTYYREKNNERMKEKMFKKLKQGHFPFFQFRNLKEKVTRKTEGSRMLKKGDASAASQW